MQPDAPIISLDDLIARPGTNSSALVRPLLFDRCRATTAEIEMVEQHVRRSLRCPLLVSNAQLPPHEAREELLRAVLDELHNHADTGAAAAERNDSSGEGTMPSASRPPLGEALRPTLALRMALSDVEASAAACARAAEGRPFAVISDAEPSSSSDAAAAPSAGSRLRQVLAERARWLRKAEALQQLARPLRQMLGISDPMSSQHQPQLVQHERAQQHGGGIGVDNGGTNGVGGAEQSGGSSSTRVRRALSFEKGAKVASGVRRALSFDRSKHRGVGAENNATYGLAAFLLAAGNKSFYGDGAWSGEWTWLPEYDRAPGAPLGPYVADAGDALLLRRSFARLDVVVDTRASTAWLTWRDSD